MSSRQTESQSPACILGARPGPPSMPQAQIWANPESKGWLGTLSLEERGLPVKEESQGSPGGSQGQG